MRRKMVDVLHQDVGAARRDDELGALIIVHDARQAGRDAGVGRVVALSAGGLVGQARLQDRLIFRGQRRLLPATGRLGRVVARNAGVGAQPLALPVGIPAFIECAGVARRHAENHRQHGRTDRNPVMHRKSSLRSLQGRGASGSVASVSEIRMLGGDLKKIGLEIRCLPTGAWLPVEPGGDLGMSPWQLSDNQCPSGRLHGRPGRRKG